MILVSDRTRGELIGMRVQGTMVRKEPARLVPVIESIVREHAARRCVVELVGFDGFVARPLWDEMNADARCCRKIEQCAVVGKLAWRRWATRLFGAVFCRAEVRFFQSGRREDAWEWAEAGSRELAGAGA